MKDKLHRSGLDLSGGQQQRLCIARAIAVEPDVILMDEPCSALDPIATARIEDLMDELKRDYTIVIVTHNMQQAARVSDWTAFMSVDIERRRPDRASGRVRADGADLHAPVRPPHGGLHHWPVRVGRGPPGAGQLCFRAMLSTTSLIFSNPLIDSSMASTMSFQRSTSKALKSPENRRATERR